MAGDPGVDVPQSLPQRVQLLDDVGRQDVLVPIQVREYRYRVVTNLKSVSYGLCFSQPGGKPIQWNCGGDM